MAVCCQAREALNLSCVSWFLLFPSGNPLQCSCLENPRDGGAWWAAVCGITQSRTRLKRLSSSSFSPNNQCLVVTFSTLYVPRCSCMRERWGAPGSSKTPYSWANHSPLPQSIPFLPALISQLFSCPKCFSSSEILPPLLILLLRLEIRNSVFFVFCFYSTSYFYLSDQDYRPF